MFDLSTACSAARDRPACVFGANEALWAGQRSVFTASVLSEPPVPSQAEVRCEYTWDNTLSEERNVTKATTAVQ